MKEVYSVKPVRGMRDILPADVEKRNSILQSIREVVMNHGFQEIETPSVEDIRKLQSKQGGENESMLFEIQRRGLKSTEKYTKSEAVDMGLRYDLTLPLSRYYANNYASLLSEFRSFQTGFVWRAERPQKGRFRQFRQCDIDLIGSSGPVAELEVLTVGCSVLRKLGLLDNATVYINDRRLLDQLLDSCKIASANKESVLIELDKLDKSSFDDVRAAITSISGVSEESARMLISAIEELSSVSNEVTGCSLSLNSIDTPLSLFDIPFVIKQMKMLNKGVSVRFDPSLVRGMGYYTGLIYEVKVPGSRSSICGGGRYDHMIGKFLGREVPAVGFSLGFERFVDLVGDNVLCQQETIALGYRTEEEQLSALAAKSSYDTDGVKIGLVKMPQKPKSAFYKDLVANGYKKLILPDQLSQSFEEAIIRAKVLDDDK